MQELENATSRCLSQAQRLIYELFRALDRPTTHSTRLQSPNPHGTRLLPFLIEGGPAYRKSALGDPVHRF